MERTTIQYNGFEYSAIEIDGWKIDKDCPNKSEKYLIADIEVWWDLLERPCMNGDDEANAIDNSIYYYCDSGFVASNPSEKEVIEYFKNLNL